MFKLETEVLVLGGGATGAGVVRDLAMRGFKTILVERGDLTTGTTGRYHGLLHSGGRYVVKDPLAARECIEENRILRRIIPTCIEDTGGFFALTPWDDPEYAQLFIEGCHKAGIPVEEITISQMLKEERYLNPKIQRCFHVPDGSADSFLATELNAESARQHRAQILTYLPVIRLLAADRTSSKPAVTGALCHDLIKDEDVEIHAGMVVNALGAWAGAIAETIGIHINIIPGKGTMVAINHRILNTVVNRCKMPSDGDIIVPAHTVAVIGTTDIPVPDPDHYAIEPWEVELMLEEGSKLVPGLREMRILRAWAGVRPLYQETNISQNRDLSRAFTLLDHEKRDGVSGLVTITSGKWTTYRKMAQVTVDLVCEKLGVQHPCHTQEEPLPGSIHGYHFLGARLAKIEAEYAYGQLLCECELATFDEVEQSITKGGAKTIDDIRRDARIGMGPCQGGFCTYRAAGMLHTLRRPAVIESNAALQDFLQERWKGLLPILWGQQLRQERLDELIYLSILNATALPGPAASPLRPQNYEKPVLENEEANKRVPASLPNPQPAPFLQATPAGSPPVDILVIGAGLAGLIAGWQAAIKGSKTRVIAKGWGALYWNPGCIDVLGYYSTEETQPLDSPEAGINKLIASNPKHPYALMGLASLKEALEAFQELCEAEGYPLKGDLDHNWLLPTALGTLRPTCLAPETMLAGDARAWSGQPALIVGFKQFTDFYPAWTAANLSAQGLPAQDVMLDLRSLQRQRFVTSRVLAQRMDTPDFRADVAAALLPKIKDAARVGLPAILGLEHSMEAWHDLQERLEVPVFEIPTLPPSIPGIRLSKLLVSAIENAGGRVLDGMQVASARINGHHVQAVYSEAASRLRGHAAKEFILATGGLLAGGLFAEYSGNTREAIFNLPVKGPTTRNNWFEQEFMSTKGHAIFRSGVRTDSDLRPINVDGLVVFENLAVVGASLADCDPIRERSLEGIALVSGFQAGKQAARKVKAEISAHKGT